MRRTVKGLSRMALLALVLALGGCKVELYTGISQKEGNEMLALLRSEGVSADKQADKDGTVRLLVEESDIAEAVEVLKRKGYPRENFSTLKDVFPKDGLISSPIEERAAQLRQGPGDFPYPFRDRWRAGGAGPCGAARGARRTG